MVSIAHFFLFGTKKFKQAIPAPIKNLNQLAGSWILAQEYSQVIKTLYHLDRQAKNDGQYLFRMGRLYMEQGNWSGALRAFERAENKNLPDR